MLFGAYLGVYWIIGAVFFPLGLANPLLFLLFIAFVIGGPYGFSSEVYAAATERLSLSRMTFSHQMVRLIFVEQLYRALNILSGGPYHHD